MSYSQIAKYGINAGNTCSSAQHTGEVWIRLARNLRNELLQYMVLQKSTSFPKSIYLRRI